MTHDNTTTNVPTELGTRGVASLLLKYALPAITAMTAASLLNNVDRFFIARCVGPLGISGLTATFPFMNLVVAFGAMVGVGASAVLSIRLGQKDYQSAQRVLGNALTLNLIISILVALVCYAFIDPLLTLFGASLNTIDYARDYMQVILLGNVITHSYFGLNSIIRAAGHPLYSMTCTIVAVCVNALLDWLFVWQWGGGIQAAAWATILSQAVALLMQLYILNRPHEVLHLQRGIYGLRLTIVRQILAVGMSPFLMNVCACLVVLIINHSMFIYGNQYQTGAGDYAVGAYGIVNSILFFFLMIVMGLNQGMQPIVGYNWGAHQNPRVWQCLRYTALAATAVTTLGFLIAQFLPHYATRIFTDDPLITQLALKGFRIATIIFPFVGVQMVLGNFFQSIGHAGKSIFLSLSRQLLFLIPALLLLPRMWGLNGVWAAMPMADGISFFFALGMLLYQVRHTRQPNMPQP